MILMACMLCGASAAAQSQAPPTTVPPQSSMTSRPQKLPEWLRVAIEHRGRFEGPMNAHFSDARDDAYWLNRFRFDVRVRPSRMVSFQVQAQDAQVFGRNAKPDAPPFEDTLDLRMAFAEIGQAGRSPVVLRAGRQELAFGDQRLVGHVSWMNTARTFDAARVTLARATYRIDAFAGSVVAIRDGEFNRSGHGEWFHGAYSTLPGVIPLASLEPYLFVRTVDALLSEAGARGTLRHATIGARLVGRLPARFDYNIEAALQRGSLASDDVRAWAGHWVLGRTVVPARSVRVFGEYNVASGDTDPADGRRGTFDQLYPTPHDKYGLADQIGWRNVHHLRAGLEFKPAAHVAMSGGYHSWWRVSRSDSVYAASGAVLVRPPAGVVSRHIGQELDVQAVVTLTPRVQLHGGYARIFPGAVLSASTPGRSYSFPYVMVTSAILKGDR
jgi:hypothetical protein